MSDNIESFRNSLKNINERLGEFNTEESSSGMFDNIKSKQKYIYIGIVVCTTILFFLLGYVNKAGFLQKTVKIKVKKGKKIVSREETKPSFSKILKWAIILSIILCISFFMYMKYKK